MLDVHPPHEHIHGWRDFLLHILTITIGLLIALALEGAVEAHRHRRDVSETREALRTEREENRRRFARNTVFGLRERAYLENNLLIFEYLQQHPGTPQSKLPGFVTWTSSNARMTTSAWKTASQSGVFAYMPQPEIQRDAELYDFYDRIDATREEETDALLQAMMYMVHDPNPSHLSPTQLTRVIELTQVAVTKYLRHGFLMQNLAAEFPEFTPAPTRDQLAQILHLQQEESDPDLKVPREVTEGRANAAAPLPPSDSNK